MLDERKTKQKSLWTEFCHDPHGVGRGYSRHREWSWEAEASGTEHSLTLRLLQHLLWRRWRDPRGTRHDRGLSELQTKDSIILDFMVDACEQHVQKHLDFLRGKPIQTMWPPGLDFWPTHKQPKSPLLLSVTKEAEPQTLTWDRYLLLRRPRNTMNLSVLTITPGWPPTRADKKGWRGEQLERKQEQSLVFGG